MSESTHSPPPCIIHPHIHCKLLIVIINKTSQPCSLTTPISATPSSKSTHPHSLPKPIETNQNKSSNQRLKLKHERESKDNVYSISALVAGDTFRYNRESPRAARVSSRTLLAKPLFAPAVEQLAFVLPLFRVPPEDTRTRAKNKRQKKANLDNLRPSPWTDAISWVPLLFWKDDS